VEVVKGASTRCVVIGRQAAVEGRMWLWTIGSQPTSWDADVQYHGQSEDRSLSVIGLTSRTLARQTRARSH